MSWFLVLGFAVSTADASYICSLTSTEVDDAISYYSLSTTRAELETWIDAPFDCSAYENLCDDVGSATAAETVVCNAWDALRNNDPWGDVMDDLDADFDSYAASNGDDAGSFAACAGRVNWRPTGVQRDDPSTGEHAIRSRSGSYNTGFVRRIGGSTTGYLRDGGTFLTQDWSGHVTVTLDLSCVDETPTLAVCDLGNDKMREDFDGYRQAGRKQPPLVNMENAVETDSWYKASDDGTELSACSERRSGWNCNC